MKKTDLFPKVLALVLCAVMLVSCLPSLVFPTLADEVNQKGLDIGENPGDGETVDDSFYAGWSVTLSDDIAVNFYFAINDADVETTTLNVTVAGESYPAIPAASASVENGNRVFTVHVAAAQMTDTIHLKLVTGGSTVHAGDYTVHQYMKALLADNTQSQYHALVKEMLNYGAMAQLYFDHNADNLANTGLTGAAAAEVPAVAEEELSVTGAAEGISFYAATLVFQNKIAVRFYFRAAAETISTSTITANGVECIPVEKDGCYYIEVAGIPPENLDQAVEVVVTGADSQPLTVSYGPMNYIVRMNVKGSDNLKNLLKALYNYHLAAKALKNA